jgi:hypothetical protein
MIAAPATTYTRIRQPVSPMEPTTHRRRRSDRGHDSLLRIEERACDSHL